MVQLNQDNQNRVLVACLRYCLLKILMQKQLIHLAIFLLKLLQYYGVYSLTK